MHSKLQCCRVCGLFFPDYYPWGEDGVTPSFDICPCCNVEFGYEDATQDGRIAYRKDWLSKGAPFHDQNQKPDNWNPDQQLASISGDDSPKRS